jgi:hypothetical protein
MTDPQTNEKRVQLVIDTDENGCELVVALEVAKFFPIGTPVMLTLESREDATH